MHKTTCLLIVLLLAQVSALAAPLTLTQTVVLDGVEGRIDHLAIDAETHHLYVAALGNNTVELVDMETWKVISPIKGILEPQGVAVMPAGGTLLVASGEDGMCRLIDRSLQVIGKVTGLDDADNVRFDAASGLAYVGFGGGALAVIDAKKGAKVGEVQLEGHPESFQLEKDGNRIFVNVPPAREIAVIDRSTYQVVARWKVEAAQSNFPMALDEPDHRLFVGCRRPAKLLVIDTDTGKTAAAYDCCGDTDDVFWDAERKRLYISGGEGGVTVLEEGVPNQFTLLDTVPTAPGARTSYFDKATHSLFVAAPRRNGEVARVLVYTVQ